MISDEDYKDIRDNAENGLTLLYRYYVANFGMRLSAGAFMLKFTEWCHVKHKVQTGFATECIVGYLDFKHDYQYIINGK